ncbi:MAG TPA: DUF1552 domain-containing protein [Planctomycetaceae bacterium]|nr:DUF1552 domain-containing protein [Planctomycetaceae bacterium]
MQKSWHLDRRTFLRGSGVAMSLPLLEGMSFGVGSKPAAELPRRMCCVYFPFGVALPPEGREDSDWNWFPIGEGREFEFRNTLQLLEPLRQDVTVLGGMSHPNGRKIGGHDTGDIFLTAARFQGTHYRNSVSIDQLAAAHIGQDTRFGSLVLSSDGGVGEPTRSTTLSFSAKGRPVPALAKPQQIFDRLFGMEGEVGKSERAKLENAASMLDLVLEHSKSIKRRLGQEDRRKLDEYLASVRAVEKRVARSQKWLSIPKSYVNPASVALNSSPKGPQDYIKAMYDLMFLAFQTDTTRLATYMLGQVAGATTIANAFPACIGLGGNWHGLAHGAGKKGGAEKLGKFDQFLANQLAYFLTRLKETPEGDGNLLDRTMVLYGSSNSRTHQNRNYPLVLAGGSKLGLQHGQFLKLGEKMPLSNVLLTMLHKLEVPVESFADSTGEVSELLV